MIERKRHEAQKPVEGSESSYGMGVSGLEPSLAVGPGAGSGRVSERAVKTVRYVQCWQPHAYALVSSKGWHGEALQGCCGGPAEFSLMPLSRATTGQAEVPAYMRTSVLQLENVSGSHIAGGSSPCDTQGLPMVVSCMGELITLFQTRLCRSSITLRSSS